MKEYDDAPPPPIPGMEMMLSPRRKTALVALALFFLLGGLAIHASPLSASSLEARLKEAADSALYRIRADEWAQVRMEGQRAVLTGLAPSRQARDAALEAVAGASWAGGVVAGGVTRVIDETRLAGRERIFGIRAYYASGRLTLSGNAPDAAAAARIEALAQRLFPGASVTLTLAPGGAPEAWEAAVRLMLAELSLLDNGAGLINADRIALTGLAANAQTAGSVRAAFETPPGEFLAAALVRTDGGRFDVRVEDAALCEMLIRGALGPRPVAFSPGLAELAPNTASALRRAGAAYEACVPEPLVIAVRAEEAGGDAEALALARAEAVADAMAPQAQARARLLALSAPADAAEALRFSVTAPADGAAQSDDV